MRPHEPLKVSGIFCLTAWIGAYWRVAAWAAYVGSTLKGPDGPMRVGLDPQEKTRPRHQVTRMTSQLTDPT